MTSAPDAVTGLMLIDSPLAGRPEVFLEALHHHALPVATRVFILSGPIIRMVRQNMARALEPDFVLHARCAGLPGGPSPTPPSEPPWRPRRPSSASSTAPCSVPPCWRRACSPSGGLGQYAIRSILAFDYPAIQGVVLVITAVSLLVYLALDLIHAAIVHG